MSTTEEFIKHHGVKGMRWGVRKDRGSSSHTPASGGSTKPKAHELSDEELKKAIERMSLEKQYHTLVNPPPPPKQESEASKFIKEMGKGLAKDLIKTGINSQLNKVTKKA